MSGIFTTDSSFPDLQQFRLDVERVGSDSPCAAGSVRVALKRSRGSIVDARQHGSAPS
jgi:hypothetical protein